MEYNLREVGEILGITRERVRQLAERRHIGARIDWHWLFTEADIEALRERADGTRREVSVQEAIDRG
jgi:hypothetical protein